MSGGHLQALLFMLNRPEPIRQSSLLMVLATGIGHAPSLMAGLKALAEESSPPWANSIEQLRLLLAQGQTLSEALTSAKGLLPEQSLIAIRVAEQTGTLKQVLAEEAHRLMQNGSTGNAIQPTLPATLVWLLCVALAVLGVLSFIMVFIIPKFKAIFEGFGTDLPGPTITLIQLSDWTANYWYLSLFPIGSLGVAAVVLFIRAQLRYLTTGHLPFAQHFPRVWTPMILRLLSVVVTTRQSLGDGIHSILKEFRPGKAAQELSGVRQSIHAGFDCWESLRDHGFLNQRELIFLQASNRTRHLDWGLVHLARTVERRRERMARLLATILQPVIILLIGAMVGFVVISLFTPIIKLINDLS